MNKNECWIWRGYKNRHGYGQMTLRGGRNEYSHRLSYNLFVGAIPKGKCVLHKCDNPPCINPDHLFLGTRKDNVTDMDKKGRRNSGSYNSVKTHCSRGHEYTADNTVYYSWAKTPHITSRRCKKCMKMWNDIRNAETKRLRQASNGHSN